MSRKTEGQRTEDQWFFEQERKLIEKMRKEREARVRAAELKESEAEREKLRKAHWLCCPKCGHPMKEREMEGILVDVCKHCEGIYFDRGELEDLLTKRQAEEKKGFFRSLIGFS